MGCCEAGPFPVAKSDRQVDVGGIEAFVVGGGDYPHLSIGDVLGELAKPRHQPDLGKIVAASDGQRPFTLPLLERGEYVADMTEPGTYRIRKPLPCRGQLEPISVACEEAKSGCAFYGGYVASHGRGGNAELGARRGEVFMPGGNLKYDQGIYRR